MSAMRLSRRERWIELVRPWLLLAGYFAVGLAGRWWLAAPLALATYFTAFAVMHDAMHAALGLTPRANRLALSANALLLLASGHAFRASHLRHHDPRRPPHESEEQYARWSLWRTLLVGPFHLLWLMTGYLRREPGTRAWQIGEKVAGCALLVASIATWRATGCALGLVYPAIALACNATLPFWAAWLPHRAREEGALKRLGRCGARLAPPIAAFVFHELHHARPWLPTRRLIDAARASG